MGNWKCVVAGTALLLGLTACGSENASDNTAASAQTAISAANEPAASSANATEAAATSGAAVKETAVPSAEELLRKSAAASKALTSFAMRSDIEQHFVIEGAEKQEQTVRMAVESAITTEPLEMMQLIAMDSPAGRNEIKQYVTKDGIYMLMGGTWTKVPQASEQSYKAGLDKAAAGPDQQLEQLRSIAKDIRVTADGDRYRLTVHVIGDKLEELAMSAMNQAGGNAEMEAMMSQMTIKSMDIAYEIQRNTYLTTSTEVNMVMEVEADEGNMSLDMTLTSKYDDYNAIGKIEVPAEALTVE